MDTANDREPEVNPADNPAATGCEVSEPKAESPQKLQSFPRPQNTNLIILHAATLLRDAKSSRFLEFKADSSSLRLYILYYHPVLKWLQYTCIFLILALATLEEPSVWPNAVPYWVCNIVEVFALFVLIFRIIHQASFQRKTVFMADKKNVAALVVIVVMFLDIVCYSLWQSLAPDKSPIRWSRPLRPLLIINFPHARQIRQAFRNIRRTLTDIIFVLTLWMCSILLFSLLALKLFAKKKLMFKNGDSYFTNYLDAFWNLYVLVTTSNNPDVMLPAYELSNWYALFFICFLAINLYIFMNILLASIFNSYKKHLKNEVKASVYSKRSKLAEAFELVKEESGEQSVLTFDTWAQILNLLPPKRSPEHVKMLFQVMDTDADGKLVKSEFLLAADLLNMPISEVKDRINVFETMFPNAFNLRMSKLIRLVVLHRAFRYFFDFAIVVNAVFIILDMHQAEWFFLALFILEIFLKLFSCGPRVFISQAWNIFDVVVVTGALLATIIEATLNVAYLQGGTLEFVLVLRVLRLIKLVNGIDRFRIVITTLVNIGPSILIYGSVLFTFYYTFALVGMELFHGKIQEFGASTYNVSALKPYERYCGTQTLNRSDYYEDRYCSNNFNNIAKAFVVLAELTVVNQWQIISQGFEIVTSKAARLYFMAFHLAVVVLIMNIFIAFILEAFILEVSLSKSKFESSIEAKILHLGYGLGQTKAIGGRTSIVDDMEQNEGGVPGPEEGTKFHLRKGRRKVDALLERMFEDELRDDNVGRPSDHKRDRRQTMEAVVTDSL